MMPQGPLLLAVWIALSPTGCENVTTRWVDPDITLADVDATAPDGPVSLRAGFTSGGAFIDLDDDDSLPIINGLQGGTWTMPTLRTTGLGSYLTVQCSIITEGDEQVGRLDTNVRSFPAAAGGLEVLGLPVAVRHAPPRQGDTIDDLYGQAATFRCDVADSFDASASGRWAVVLVEGR